MVGKKYASIAVLVGLMLIGPGVAAAPAEEEGDKKGFFQRLFGRGTDAEEHETGPVDTEVEAAALSTVTVYTTPQGGSVTVRETGQTMEDGETIELAPGSYTLKASKLGHRDAKLSIKVTGKDLLATVPLGQATATVSISTKPVHARIAIDGKSRGNAPLAVELNKGKHTVTVSNPGHYSASQTLRVKAGKPIDLIIALKRIATQSLVSITTQPENGAIRFRDQQAGVGRADLGYLDFGNYTVSGVKQLDERARLTGSQTFQLGNPKPHKVVLVLDKKERLFEQKWLPEAEAREKEEARYRRLRVTRPVAVEVQLTPTTLAALKKIPDFASHLVAVMRVGDRLSFERGKQSWNIWKRHNKITYEFKKEIEAFLAKMPSAITWKADPETLNTTVRPGVQAFSDIAFALHRARARQPLIDLTREQLVAQGETVTRAERDGTLTLIVQGGEEVSVLGASIHRTGELHFAEIKPSSREIKLKWKSVPARIMVIGDTKDPLLPLDDKLVLKKGEKRIVALAKDVSVTALTRFTEVPGAGWRRETFDNSGPLTAQIDLSKDEIGPHTRPGQYTRYWLLRYTKDRATTQRQIGVTYQVSDEAMPTTSNEFLRH